MKEVFATSPQKSFAGHLEAQTKVFLLSAQYQGKPVFYYLQLPSYRQQHFKQRLLLRRPVKPSQYGKILACGYGNPSPTLEKKMAREFKVCVFRNCF